MSRELLPQTVKLTASELSWLAGSGVVVLNFCSATMYGLRTFLWSIGLVYYVGHPQPPQSYWARVYCGCQPGPTRVALHPGRMMEKPERQPYIHWTTFYDFEETRNIELCSLQASTHHDVLNADLECGSTAVFQMHHFIDACGAELRSCCVFRNLRLIFYLLLCDVGCFFVTQSHSIKVSRWSSLVIFFFFFSSPVVLPRSLCRLLRIEPNFRSLWL